MPEEPRGYLLDAASIHKLRAMLQWHEEQQRTQPQRKRRVRRGPYGGGDSGFDRIRARAANKFDPATSAVTCNNVAATRGPSPTSQASDTLECFNDMRLAGKAGDTVLAEYDLSTESWNIYQVQHQPATIVKDMAMNGLDIHEVQELKASIVSDGQESDTMLLQGTDCPLG